MVALDYRGRPGIAEAIEHLLQEEDELAVSSISCWEVQLLEQRGRIVLPIPSDQWITEALAPCGVKSIDINCEIARISAALPAHHKDPADRIIIASAMYHHARLASMDSVFPSYSELDRLLISG